MRIPYLLTLVLAGSSLFAESAKVYVTEIHGGSVSVINTEDDSVQSIYGFTNPRVIKITPDGTLAYVGEDTDTIQFFETETHLVSPTSINVAHAVAMAIAHDGKNAFVASGDDTLATIDLTTNTVQSVLVGFSNIQDVKATPNGQFIYVTNAGNNTVSVVDRTQGMIIGVITGFQNPLGITITHDGSYAFVSNVDGNSLSVIRLADNTVIGEIPGLNDPKYIAVSPDGATVYVTSFGDNSVKVIAVDENASPIGTITNSISVFQPAAITITPDGNYLYVASGSSTIVKLKTTDYTVANHINGFQNPTNITSAIAPEPCQYVDGCQGVKEYPTGIHFFNNISWNAAPGVPALYKIYKDADLTDLVGETTDLFFQEDVDPYVRNTYYVIAEYPNGFTTTIGNILVVPCRKCHTENQSAS